MLNNILQRPAIGSISMIALCHASWRISAQKTRSGLIHLISESCPCTLQSQASFDLKLHYAPEQLQRVWLLLPQHVRLSIKKIKAGCNLLGPSISRPTNQAQPILDNKDTAVPFVCLAACLLQQTHETHFFYPGQPQLRHLSALHIWHQVQR